MLLKIQVPRTGLNDEIVLTSFPITIGRAPDNTLVLEDSWVSRHHIKIEKDNRKLILTDLGAANGLYLNDHLIQPRTPVVFDYKDRIGIGEFQLWFESGGAQVPSSPAHWVISPQPLPGLVVSMGGQVYRYPFDESIITIGRNPDNSVILDHPMVSRRHGEIRLESGKYSLHDVGSTNGFIFKGERVTQHSLEDGNLLTIPGTDIRFEFRTHIGHLTADRPLRKVLTLFKPKAAAALGLLSLKGMEVITIGRANNNHIVLSHPQVEPYHATVERSGSRYRVLDLNSLSGVYVNGLRIDKEAWLHINDEIRVNSFRFTLHESGLERLADAELRVEAIGLKDSSPRHRIEELSLCFGPDELIAVVGANASQRTALVEALSTVRPPSSGMLVINGVNLHQTKDQYRHDIGYVPHKDIVHPELTVFAALDFAAQLRMLPNTSDKERQQRIDEVLNDLGLTAQRDRRIGELATYQVRRINLGVELLTQPRLLFLDEPTTGLESTESVEMMRLLRKLVDQGRSVLLTAAVSPSIMICDKVAILSPDGNLAFYGPPETALAYFATFQELEENQASLLDFDQIQSILSSEQRDSDQSWKQRFLESKPYKDYISSRIHIPAPQQAPPQPVAQIPPYPQTGFLRQFSVLTRRNFTVFRRDRIFLGLVLILGPIIGMINITWGSNVFDLQAGSPSRVITAMLMAAFTSVLVGIGISVRETIREAHIYKHERTFSPHLFAYVCSKMAIGALITLYQSLLLTAFFYLFMLRGSPVNFANYGLFLVAIFLGIISGYLIGFIISTLILTKFGRTSQ